MTYVERSNEYLISYFSFSENGFKTIYNLRQRLMPHKDSMYDKCLYHLSQQLNRDNSCLVDESRWESKQDFFRKWVSWKFKFSQVRRAESFTDEVNCFHSCVNCLVVFNQAFNFKLNKVYSVGPKKMKAFCVWYLFNWCSISAWYPTPGL